MKKILSAYLLLFVLHPSFAATPTLTNKTTTAQFALECQHPALKSNPDERTQICIKFLQDVAQRVAMRKKAPECWKAIETGTASPMVLADVLFADALDPQRRNDQAADAAALVATIVAPECK